MCWLPFHFISCAGFELRVRGPNTCAFSLSHLICLFIYLCRSSMFVFFIKKYLLGNYANVIWLGRGHSAFISPLLFIIKSTDFVLSFFWIAFLHCFFISSSYLLKMSDYFIHNLYYFCHIVNERYLCPVDSRNIQLSWNNDYSGTLKVFWYWLLDKYYNWLTQGHCMLCQLPAVVWADWVQLLPLTY